MARTAPDQSMIERSDSAHREEPGLSRREYNRDWMRRSRRRVRPRAYVWRKMGPSTGANRRRYRREYMREWRRRNPRLAHEAMLRQCAARRAPKCFACGKTPSRAGVAALEKILRMIPGRPDGFVRRSVLWCGRC